VLASKLSIAVCSSLKESCRAAWDESVIITLEVERTADYRNESGRGCMRFRRSVGGLLKYECQNGTTR
jgi:hypothetical protein